MKKLGVLAATVSAVGLAAGGDGVWTNVGSAAANWSDSGNWSGGIPGGSSANSDQADFSAVPESPAVVTLPTLGWPREWHLGSLSGSGLYSLHGPSSGRYLWRVGNPSAFSGTWIVGPVARSAIEGTSTDSLNPRFASVSNEMCAIIRNAGTAAGSRVIVGSLSGDGVALVNGPDNAGNKTSGLVEIERTGGAGQHLGVMAGGVVLTGGVADSAECGLGTLELFPGATVAVESGVFRALDFKIGDPALSKGGQGTLEIGNLYAADGLDLDIPAGSIRFGAAGVVSTEGPAPNPYLWVDASDTSQGNMEWTEDAGRNLVTKWHDVRGTSRPGGDLVVYASDPAHCPRWVVGPGGRTVMDFGDAVSRSSAGSDWPSGDFGYFSIPYGGSPHVKEAFVVYRRTGEDFSTANRLFGSNNNADLLGGTGEYGLFNIANGSQIGQRSVARQNGVPITDISASESSLAEFSVLSVVAQDLLTVQYVGTDRCLSAGGVQFGEIIYYDRALTEPERKDTEAYLMAKWLGRAHPATKDVSLGTVSFGSGTDRIIDSDRAITIGKVVGSGDVIKRGSGSATISSLALLSGSVAVSNGTLAVGTLDALAAVSNAMARACLHVDALKSDSFTYSSLPGCGDSVDRWYDVRGGQYVQSVVQSGLTNAIRRTSAATGLKPGLAYVDLLGCRGSKALANDAATLKWYTQSGSSLNDQSVREVHMVFADADDVGGPWLGFSNSNDMTRQFMRNASKAHGHGLFEKAWSPVAAGSAFRADGDTVDNDHEFANGFHVLRVVTPDTCWANNFGNDRNLNYGGMKLAEVLVFDEVLDAQSSDALHAYLLEKWRGLGSGVRSSFLRLSAGRGLSIGGAAVGLDEDAELEFAFSDARTVGGLSLSGSLAPSGAVMVRVNVPDGVVVRSGSYPLVTGGAVAGGLSDWNLVCDPKAFGGAVKLECRDGDVNLCVGSRGLMLILR